MSLQLMNIEDLWKGNPRKAGRVIANCKHGGSLEGDPRKAGAQDWSSPKPLSKPSFFCSQVFFGYDPSSSTSLLSSVMDHRITFYQNCHPLLLEQGQNNQNQCHWQHWFWGREDGIWKMDGWQGPILCPNCLPICCGDFSDIDNSIICLYHLQTFLGVQEVR